jgi:hypothetical membrane protein
MAMAGKRYKHGTALLWAGLFGAPLFVASLLIFGSLQPGYSHFTRASSRLGALGVPGNMGFNVFGFLLPGLLAAGVAWELRRAERVAGVPTRSSIGLLVYGMMLALTAVPADIEHMFQSPWTWVHAFFVTAPVPLWAVVLPGCAKSLRVLGASRHEATLFLVLGYLVIAEFFCV